MEWLRALARILLVIATGAAGCAPAAGESAGVIDAAPAVAVRQGGPPSDHPDKETVFAVPLAGAPSEGAEPAKVTIVVGFEFTCPYCRTIQPTLDELLGAYPGDVRIVYRHYLLHEDTALLPALAACAAQEQGRFFELADALWALETDDVAALDEDGLVRIASDLELDVRRFRAVMGGTDCLQTVRQDHAELAALGVSGTPTSFINGRYVFGARSLASFQRKIDAELDRVDKRLRDGAAVESYYETEILGKGRTRFYPIRAPLLPDTAGTPWK